MKIINRVLILDLFCMIAEGIVLFTFVFLIKRLYDLTDLLVAGGTSFYSTFLLLFSLLPSIMIMTFPMAILLASLMVYGRLAHENELVALQAGGYTVRQLLVPALLVGLILTCTLLWWGDRIAPKGLRMFQNLAAEILQETATTGIRPGSFNLLGNYIFSPSEIEDGKMKYLKMFELKNNQVAGVITAPSGTIEYLPNDKILSLKLEDGALHQIPSKDRDVVVQFDEMEFSLRMDSLLSNLANAGKEEQQYSSSMLDHLIQVNRNNYIKETEPEMKRYWKRVWKQEEVEKVKRVALPVACLLMAITGGLLGMGLRSGKRSTSYGMTILVIFVYYVLLSFGKSFAEDGTLPASIAMYIPNMVCLIIIAILYYRSQRV
jgi:lipopolysaccharide export system permease protein